MTVLLLILVIGIVYLILVIGIVYLITENSKSKLLEKVDTLGSKLEESALKIGELTEHVVTLVESVTKIHGSEESALKIGELTEHVVTLVESVTKIHGSEERMGISEGEEIVPFVISVRVKENFSEFKEDSRFKEYNSDIPKGKTGGYIVKDWKGIDISNVENINSFIYEKINEFRRKKKNAQAIFIVITANRKVYIKFSETKSQEEINDLLSKKKKIIPRNIPRKTPRHRCSQRDPQDIPAGNTPRRGAARRGQMSHC